MKYRPIFYDTETTGLSSTKDKIVEIAAFDPFLDKTFHSLINPEIPIPKQASSIHNITDEMVEKEPLFKDIAQSFIDFCKDDCFLIAHNNEAFDILFLKEEFKRANIPIPKFKCIDTLKWARKYRPDLPSHSLQYLREIYNIEKNTAHRALDDVIMLYKVFTKMIDDLDYKIIYDLLNKKIMPFGKYKGRDLNKIPKDYIVWLREKNVFEKPENKALKQAFEKLKIL